MNSSEQVLMKIKQTGSIDLMDLRQLRLADLEKLEKEIKYWCLYGNGKLERFGRDIVVN